MQWFKLYGAEMLADPKYQRLNASERSCWITLLCLASMNDGEVKHCEEQYLISHSGIEPSDLSKAHGILLKFEMLGMIKMGRDNDGVSIIYIKNWAKRQEKTAMTGYERVKKWRESKRLQAGDNEMITGDNGKSRIEEKRLDKNITPPAPKGAEDEEGAFISLFGGINPSYGELFKRKPQRAAAGRLLKQHPFEWWKRFMESYVNVLEDRFCPKATTPAQLEDKLAAIIAYGRSRQNKGVKLV